MTFLVNDRSTGGRIPAVAVTITENSDGSLSFELKVIGPYTGDLRGFFFDLADESRIGTLSVTPTSPGFTEFRQGDDSIKDLGNGANMHGLLGSDGGYDAGIEIGSAGIGKDDYQSFSFTLASSAGPLTLEDFSNVDFGLRLTSVGFDRWGGRDGGVKLLEHTSSAIDAIDDSNAVGEDQSPNSVGGNVFANDENLECAHFITAVNGSAWNIGHEVEGLYGTLRLKLDGSYTYTLDNTKPAVQALAQGQQVTETFSYTAKSFDEFTSFSTDSALLTITITGANDAPEIAGDTTGEVFEDGSRHASGQLAGVDPDANSELTWSVVGSGPMTPRADYRFLLDNLNIVRDGAVFFNDDFGGGGPPPAAPAFGYFTGGTFLESGGRAIMDGGLGTAFTIPGAGTVIAQTATLNTDTGPDVTQGLKRGQDFRVEARYDLVMPEEGQPNNYVVRLSDGADDIVEVGVRRMEDGSVAVVLREVDMAGTVPVILEAIPLAPAPGDQQIVLRLEHAANSDVITASFDLLNGGVVTQSHAFTQTGDIFSNETWTRAQVTGQSLSTPQNGVYGTLSVEADGEWQYSLNNAAGNVQALAQGEHVEDVFTITVTDEHGASDTATVTIDVTGSNDAPIITGGTNFGFVAEDTPTQTASGQLFAFDVDHGAQLSWSAGPATLIPVPGVPNAFSIFGYSSDFHFTLDRFSIERNGVTLFDDPFSDGIAPPSAPNFANGIPASYLGTFGYTEAGGRLHLDGAISFALRGVGNDDLSAGQLPVLLTNNDPSDFTRGLKSDDSFSVEGRFDLVVPGPGQAYGIALTDNAFGGLPPDQLGDDTLTLIVRSDPGGGLLVQFNDLSIVADTSTPLEALAFSPEPGENQIVLHLIHDVAEPGLVRAEFDLLGGAGGPRTFELTGTGHIFGSGTPGYPGDDENWTRAQIVAFGPDTGGATFQGTYGSLTVDENGNWTYTLDNDSPAVQALPGPLPPQPGQPPLILPQDNISVRVVDEHGMSSFRLVSVAVAGSNDAPEIAGDTTGEVFEDGSRSASGQLDGLDPDANSQLTWSVVGSGPMTPRADYRFLLDNLSIVRDGVPFFNDDFGAGGPPPAAPAFNYFTFGTFTEFGGRAIMDGALGGLVTLPGAGAVTSHVATLNTDISPDPSQGLKRTQDFTVEARYDLVLPEELRSNYLVRLSDNADDIVELGVRRMEDGSVAVVLREINAPGTVPVLLETIALEPEPGNQQIVLRLQHAANADVVSASFDLLNGGLVTQTGSFTATAGVFNGEDWTRAQVLGQALATPQNGVYGTLSVQADGEWHYSLNNAAANVQALTQGEHVEDVFTITVTDEHGASDTETVTIDVTGSNDLPIITGGTNFGFVAEDTPTQTASGQLFATDVDHGAVLRWSAGPSSSLPVPGVPNAFQFFGYSSDYHFTVDQFTIERNGAVIFDDPFGDGFAPPSAPAFANGVPASYQAIGGYTESGGRLHLDGEFAAALRGVANPNLVASQAALLLTNIDPADLTRGLKSDDDFTVEARFDLAVPGDGQAYGISLTDNSFGGLPADRIGDSNVNLLVRPGAGGGLIVQLNDFDNIADSATTLESLPFSPESGESQIVLRLVHDVDQPGLVHAEFDLLDDEGVTRTFELTQPGHIFGSATPGYAGDDENWTRAQLVAFGPDTESTTFQGTYGSLTVEQNGAWNYTLDNGLPAVQALAQSQFAQDVISVRVADEHGLSSFRPVFISVQGSNDPVVTTGGVTSGAVAEDTILTAFGSVSFTDVDLADVHGAFFTPAPTNTTALGFFSLGFVDEAPDSAHGSVGWSYNLDNAAAQFLAQGETVFETYTVTVQDFWGSFTTQDVTIAIMGRDEVVGNIPPDITGGTTTGQVYEDGAAGVARGQLTALDPELGTLTWTIDPMPATAFGSANVGQDGQWTYFLNNGLVQQLGQGGSAQDQFTVRVTDPHGASDTQTVTVNVTGTGDRPNFTTPAPVLMVSEDGGFVSGQTSAFEIDSGTVLHWSLNRGSTSGYFSDYEFRADSFSIQKNGAPLFHDGFDAGGPPPSAPDFIPAPPPGGSPATSYSTTGIFQEIGGNLVMRGSNAFAFRGTGNDALVVGNEAILSTNVDPANLQAGLKQNHQFVVEGVFDLIEPGQPRQGYGLTLTDAVNRIADDLLSLTVTRDPGDNQVYVRFANSSSVLDTAVLVDRDLLVAGGADQIRLMLSHAADSGNVTASYELLDDGVIVGGGDLGEAGIFGADTPGFSGDDENWIRAGLFSNGLDAGEFVQTLAGAYGTLTVDNSEVNNIGQLIYTPGAAAQALGQGDSVVDTFFVRVIDPQGMSNSQRVDITVTGFNDPPDPEADSNSVVEDVVTRAVGNVLTNDFDVDHGSVLTVATPGTFFGTYGTLTLNANGAYEYQLDHALADFLAEGQVVHDVFEGVYGITDGALTNFATLLEIEITGTGEAPVPLAGEVFEDGSRSASGELVPAGTWSVDNPGTLTNPAYRFLIDNFSVTRNGLPYFDDGFGNNVPPPSAPGLQNELPPNTPSYALNGSFQESGGRVILDGSRSVEVEGTGSPGSRFATSARLLTDNTADFTRGLKIDDSFTVEGRFDLVLDLDPRDHYGVRLTDSGGGVTGSDLVQAVVRRDAGGNLEVALVELDGPTDSSITLEAIALVPEEGENQILLRLSHDPADQGVVHASFDLIGDPTPRSFSFTEVGHIFGTGTPGDASDDEVFTRAEFRASADGAMENGVYGTLSVDADGNWNYELNNAAASVQALAQDERASDLFLVRNGAGDTQVLRIDVVGSDDAPVGVNIGFASFFQGPAFTGTYVIEDSAQQVTRGHAFATDVDHGAALQWSVSPVTIVPTGPSSFQVFGYSSDYHFTVDQLTVERNGVVIFDDPFSDGLAPPSAPPFANGTPANYLTNLARFSEAGDRLVLDGSAANAVRGIGNPDLAAGHIAVLGSNIDPADPTRGLKSDDDFTVEARFDLVTPSVAQGYGLSLTDNTTGGLPPDQLGDDGINLFVRADAVGSLRVEFTRFDIPADTVTLYQSLPFAPGPGENQIVLRLTHDVDNPGQVHAAFDLLDGVGGVNTTQFDQLGQIFGTGTPGYAGDDENWTRAQIVAFGPDSYAGVTTLQGIYGSLSVDPNGDFTYTLDNGAANVQALAQGQVAVDSFNVRATDQYGLSNRVVLNVNVIGTGEEAPPAPAPDVLGDGQNNVLVGSSLGERFYGGNGADLLIGLDGSDTFDYNALSEGGDTIADFTPGAGGDILDLSDLVPPGTPNPADSVQLQEFQTANGPSTTVLFDHVPFATLQGVGGLVLSDFVADNLFL